MNRPMIATLVVSALAVGVGIGAAIDASLTRSGAASSSCMTAVDCWQEVQAASARGLSYETTTAPTTTTTAPATTTTTVPAGGTTINFTTANYPTRYGTCATITDLTHLTTNLTSACNPGGDGHYRTDWSTNPIFPAGPTTCVSFTVSFPNGTPTVASGSWWQFAEAVVPGQSAFADWGLYVSDAFGPTQFDLRMGLVNGRASLWHGGNPDAGGTFKVCSNYSTTTTGFIDVYLDGTAVYRLAAHQIMPAGQTADSLDLNDYTGGSPVPNVVVHGAPVVG